MGLARLIRPEFIQIDGPALSKEEMIRTLVEPLTAAGLIQSSATVTRALMERERVMSTGLGGGIALPHAQSSAVRQFAVAIGRPAQPVDFHALDEKPVRLIFLAVGPEDRIGLMRILTRISRLIYTGDLQKKLMEAKSGKEMMRLIAAEEAKLGTEAGSLIPGEDGSST